MSHVHVMVGLFALCCACVPPQAKRPLPAASAESPAQADPRFDLTLSGYEYPYPVAYHELDSQGQKLRMAYLDVRAATSPAETVLLLHGKNFSAAYWAPTIRALTERGFRVLAPDQLGFGKSAKPGDYQYSFQQLALNTKRLLDALGVGKVHVVGHSMGGMLATRFALMYPEAVHKLVLVNPIGLEDWKTVVPYRSIDAWYREELKATPESIRAYQQKSYYDGTWRPEYEASIEIAKGVVEHPDYPKVAWVSALLYDMIFTQPVLYEFPRLRVPTQLIIGQRDRTALGRGWADEQVAATLGDYPELGRRAAEAIPGAKLVLLPGIGHMPQVEAFDRYIEALTGFLLAPE